MLVPSSNAVVERVFSQVTATKTKPRNRLGVESLDSIIRIKCFTQMRDICCTKFTVTDRMRSLHTANKDRKRHTSEATSQLTLGGACANPAPAAAADDEDEDKDGVLAFLDD